MPFGMYVILLIYLLHLIDTKKDSTGQGVAETGEMYFGSQGTFNFRMVCVFSVTLFKININGKQVSDIS